eukprot:131464-Prymnesium_polylepis.1
MEIASESFRQAFAGGTELPPEAGLDIVQFALQLLSPKNDVVAHAPCADEISHRDQPFAHYWTAASHNSCTPFGIEPKTAPVALAAASCPL